MKVENGNNNTHIFDVKYTKMLRLTIVRVSRGVRIAIVVVVVVVIVNKSFEKVSRNIPLIYGVSLISSYEYAI